MLKSANLGLNIFEGQDNVKRISFVENFNLLDRSYGELVKNNSEYVRTTGNANIYLASKDGLTSYYEGLCLKIKIHVDSNGNCTLNLNGLGAKYIRDSYGNIVTNLKKDIPYHVCYNGSDFILLGKGGGGNAQPNHVLENYTFTNDSGSQKGNMPNQGTKIYTPGRNNIAIPAGYHNGQGYVKGEPNLIPQNLVAGLNYFGIQGTATIQSLGGRKYKTGTFTRTSGVDIVDVGFRPTLIIAIKDDAYSILISINDTMYGYINRTDHVTSGGGLSTWGNITSTGFTINSGIFDADVLGIYKYYAVG